jgi:toxin YoeB
VTGRIIWWTTAWDDYLWWQKNDRKMITKINRMLTEIQRTPAEGVGKPEMLRSDLSGWWSRRIDQEHRIVYRVHDGDVEIIQCRFHY